MKTLDNYFVKNQNILLRVDLNVPVVDDVVTEYMLEHPNVIKNDLKPVFGQLSKMAKKYIMDYMRDN